MKYELAVRGRNEVADRTNDDDIGGFYRWEPVVMGVPGLKVGICDMPEDMQRRFVESDQFLACAKEIIPLLSNADDVDRLNFIMRLVRTCYRAGGGEKDEYIKQMDAMVERMRPRKGTLLYALDKLFENSEGWLHAPRAVKSAVEDGQKKFKRLLWELKRMESSYLPSAELTGPPGSHGS